MSHLETSLLDVFERYLLAREIDKQYAYTMRKRCVLFWEWLLRQEITSLAAIREDHLNKWLMEIQASGLKNVTVASYRRAILTLWTYAADLDLCDYPRPRRIRKLKIVTPPPIAYFPQEIEQLLQAASSLVGEYRVERDYKRKIARSHYWTSIILAAYETGLRKGDLIQLKSRDVLQDRFIVTANKTGRSEVRSLSHRCPAILVESRAEDRELAWGWAYTKRGWFDEFAELRELSGVQGSFKWLRRTHGSVMGTLNHASRDVFEKHYCDLRLAPLPDRPPELKF